ncbi:hypothetical protein [Virgibacillus proomii]|jgi:hypothetical protein|uniref:hypothetical protein n=1 Tax=Virgibacillus proomii TaxID=84407 RepID=UPI0009867895|nr:hypothetical protein [Virgibacillus proomii]
MNNNRSIMTSLVTVGAIGAVIYGVSRGIQNGTFQRWQQTLSNAMNNPQVQQLMQPLNNMTNNQGMQQTTSNLQSGINNGQQQ